MGETVDASGLKQLFLGASQEATPRARIGCLLTCSAFPLRADLGYDKVQGGTAAPAEPAAEAPAEAPAEAAEGAEGEEKKEEEAPAAAPAPAPPAGPSTQNAESVFELLDAEKQGKLHIVYILSTIALCKSGYNEGALAYALKAADLSGAGALLEPQVWVALTSVANAAFTPVVRNHLRKLWRSSGKQEVAPPPAAEGAEGEAAPEGEAGSAAAAAVPQQAPEDVKVLVDSLTEKLKEDERLASLFTKEIAIPITLPPPAEGEAATEEAAE